MRLAHLKKQVSDLAESMHELSARLDELSDEIAQIEEYRPFTFRPEECRIDVGVLRLKRRPAEPISPTTYWSMVASQIQDLLDEEDDAEHWIGVIRRAEPGLGKGSLPELLNRSEYVRAAIGPVPEQIWPEEFRFDPDQESDENRQGLEEFVFRVWPHAG